MCKPFERYAPSADAAPYLHVTYHRLLMAIDLLAQRKQGELDALGQPHLENAQERDTTTIVSAQQLQQQQQQHVQQRDSQQAQPGSATANVQAADFTNQRPQAAHSSVLAVPAEQRGTGDARFEHHQVADAGAHWSLMRQHRAQVLPPKDPVRRLAVPAGKQPPMPSRSQLDLNPIRPSGSIFDRCHAAAALPKAAPAAEGAAAAGAPSGADCSIGRSRQPSTRPPQRPPQRIVPRRHTRASGWRSQKQGRSGVQLQRAGHASGKPPSVDDFLDDIVPPSTVKRQPQPACSQAAEAAEEQKPLLRLPRQQQQQQQPAEQQAAPSVHQAGRPSLESLQQPALRGHHERPPATTTPWRRKKSSLEPPLDATYPEADGNAELGPVGLQDSVPATQPELEAAGADAPASVLQLGGEAANAVAALGGEPSSPQAEQPPQQTLLPEQLPSQATIQHWALPAAACSTCPDVDEETQPPWNPPAVCLPVVSQRNAGEAVHVQPNSGGAAAASLASTAAADSTVTQPERVDASGFQSGMHLLTLHLSQGLPAAAGQLPDDGGRSCAAVETESFFGGELETSTAFLAMLIRSIHSHIEITLHRPHLWL